MMTLFIVIQLKSDIQPEGKNVTKLNGLNSTASTIARNALADSITVTGE